MALAIGSRLVPYGPLRWSERFAAFLSKATSVRILVLSKRYVSQQLKSRAL